VTPALAGTSTTGIFSDTMRPRVAVDRDRNAVELGVKFIPQRTGSVTGLQYYQGSRDENVTSATLWSSSGTALATVNFAATTKVGWRTIALTKPVALTAGTSYVVSYYAPRGGYSVTEGDLRAAKSLNGFTLKASAGVYSYSSSRRMPVNTYKGSNYLADVVFAPGVAVSRPDPTPTPTTSATPTPTPTKTATPTPTPTPTPTKTATPTPTPTPTPTSTPTPPPGSGSSTGGYTVLGRSFPSANTTGVPAGTTLTKYTGPCTIQTPNVVIDAKLVDCDLRILAKGIVISRSQINGNVYSDADMNNGSFTISDSWVNNGAYASTGIGDANFVAIRVEVSGGSRSVNCYRDCTVQDSYLHGQYTDKRGIDHESAVRMGSNSIIRHNTIACDAPDVPPDAGCSAALTGYGDFAIVQKNVIDDNLIWAGSGGYCAYGGSTAGKPYSAGVNNIKFTNNVWQKGESGQCGFWGPITSFDSRAPGNVWTNNLYDDGKPVPPAN
jgi:hypothetical protein